MSDVLLKNQIDGEKGSVIRLTLNAPKLLNALSTSMIKGISRELDRMESDNRLKCLVIEGAGDKAFCAGGDIKEMYEQLSSGGYELSDQFFGEEYALDYRLSVFPKPVVALVNGIVMGGGVGIMQGCRYRIVTENTRFAMPETQIGLYPDVSGGFFLNRIPKHYGKFMGLTGVTVNAGDLLNIGLGDRLIPADQIGKMPDVLAKLAWTNDAAENQRLVYRTLKEYAKPNLAPDGQLAKHDRIIADLMDSPDLSEIVKNIQSLPDDDKFLAGAKNNINYASPLSLAVTFEMLQRFKALSLKEVFESEYILSKNFLRHGEFCEGVRALLIDRDRSPNWRYKTVEEVPPEAVSKMFERCFSQDE